MFGVNSMTGPLTKVAVKKPGTSLKNANAKKWHYNSVFDPKKVSDIHNTFVQTLEGFGIEIYWMPEDDLGIADSVFTYDASLMTKSGAILMSPGKKLRTGEQNIHRDFYKNLNIPIIGSIKGKASAEAGDTLWLDENTLVVGRGFRTNQLGINQLKKIITPLGIEVHVFDLPFHLGSDACLHLMSLISLVDTKTALVYLPLLPVDLWHLLNSKGFSVIEAPAKEFETSNTLSTNVLALAPGECLMLNGLPETQKILLDAGIKITVFDGNALCIGCEGGPTCLTRPLHRITE